MQFFDRPGPFFFLTLSLRLSFSFNKCSYNMVY